MREEEAECGGSSQQGQEGIGRRGHMQGVALQVLLLLPLLQVLGQVCLRRGG